MGFSCFMIVFYHQQALVAVKNHYENGFFVFEWVLLQLLAARLPCCGLWMTCRRSNECGGRGRGRRFGQGWRCSVRGREVRCFWAFASTDVCHLPAPWLTLQANIRLPCVVCNADGVAWVWFLLLFFPAVKRLPMKTAMFCLPRPALPAPDGGRRAGWRHGRAGCAG